MAHLAGAEHCVDVSLSCAAVVMAFGFGDPTEPAARVGQRQASEQHRAATLTDGWLKPGSNARELADAEPTSTAKPDAQIASATFRIASVSASAFWLVSTELSPPA